MQIDWLGVLKSASVGVVSGLLFPGLLFVYLGVYHLDAIVRLAAAVNRFFN